jgi:hypothetical protein
LRKLSRLLSGLEAQLGREINPHIFTVEDFKRRRQTREHFVSNVMAAPKLFVIGNEDELATMG